MPNREPPADRRVRPPADRHARKGHGAPFYLLVLVTTVLVVNAILGDHGVVAIRRAQHQNEQMQSELARVRDENNQLREQARRLSDDPATIEDIARSELGLMRPGEVVFIIKDLPPTGAKK